MSRNPSNPKSERLTLRMTLEQRAILERKAGRIALGEYLRSIAIDESLSPKQSRNLYPIKDQKVANQLLGELGRSNISANLATLASAAKIGGLTLSEEESAVLITACADIAKMRRMLMLALGHRSAANDN